MGRDHSVHPSLSPDLSLDLNSNPDFNTDLNLDSNTVSVNAAVSLAFVFDVTGSMYDDLQQVIEGASRILEKTLTRRNRTIQNFVLVPFHDPDIGPVSITTDPREFQKDLQELFVQGGGDCPEMSIGAIKKALELSLPGSFIYVFTDARAKDYRLKSDVLQLIQLRQSQVVFVLTGDCGDRSQPGYKVYEEIAATSSGQIFHLDKHQVNEVLKWVEETVQAVKVHLLSSDHENGQESYWEVPFDSSLKEVTVSLSGPVPHIELRDPFGRSVGEKQGLTELLTIPNSARVVRLKTPAPGIWTLKVSCQGRHTLRVTAVSHLDFRVGFSTVPVTKFSRTRERPTTGVPVHVLLKSPGLSHPGVVSGLEVLNTEGRSLHFFLVPFPADGGDAGLWTVTEFWTPSQAFFLKVLGKDERGYDFQRLSPVSYTSISPEAPVVSVPDVLVSVVVLDLVLIRCSVESDLPFKLSLTKDGVIIKEEKSYESSATASWEISQASVRDEGVYECVAHSAAGTGRALTQLTVTVPPSVHTGSSEVSTVLGSSTVLRCDSEGKPEPTVTWLKNGRVIVSSPRLRISAGGQTLRVEVTHREDEGTYTCRATNPAGTALAHYTLNILVPPQIQDSPSPGFKGHQNVRINQTLMISCFAKGPPEPTTQWLKDGQVLDFAEGHLLKIEKVSLEDEGRYTCIVSNSAGEDRRDFNVSVQIPPVLYRTSSRASEWTLGQRDDEEMWRERREDMMEKTEVILGHPVSLSCESNAVPPAHLRWFKGGQQLDATDGALLLAGGQVLQIPSVRVEDGGMYTCQAVNEAGEDQMTFHVEVIIPPEISGSSDEFVEDVPAVVNSTVLLHCDVRGSPSPSVSWLRDGVPFHSHQKNIHIQENGKVLQIVGVQLSDVAGYLCVAENKAGTVQKLYRLSVQVRPRIMGEAEEEVAVVEGHEVSLLCEVEAFPAAEIIWTRDGQLLQFGSGVHILPAPPTLLPNFGSEVMTPQLGSEVTLRCEARGVPDPQVTWYHNGQQLDTHSGPQHQLRIEQVQASLFTRFRQVS
ncbi:hemicentin-2-like [Hoplias malabaricus]|uniref:hemicentin-2-like n=1 Tax=Hoplias malabaricus TaxID=27720 RepID=UPI0034633DDC